MGLQLGCQLGVSLRGPPTALTCRQHLLIVCHVPALLLALGAAHDHIVAVGRVRLHLDVVDAEVAFHPEPARVGGGVRTLQLPQAPL